jgi:cell division protein FtsB
MKHCPNCQTRYTDDTLRFCLQDGTPLADDSEEVQPTVAFGETETVVSPRQVEPLPVNSPETSAPNWGQSRETPVQPIQGARRKSKTFLVVLLTAFLTLLLLGAGGIGAWLYLRNQRNNQNEVAGNTAGNNQTANTNSNTKSNVKSSPSPTATPKNQLDANAANAVESPAPVDAAQVRKEVSARINSWIALTESRNINDYMNLYAGTVDYYNQKSVGAGSIRSDKQRAFNNFDSIEMNVSNLSVTPDASGERATAVFDKEWIFEGEDKYSAGKVQSQLQLRKINGQWLITGERDLKVYYTE